MVWLPASRSASWEQAFSSAVSFSCSASCSRSSNTDTARCSSSSFCAWRLLKSASRTEILLARSLSLSLRFSILDSSSFLLDSSFSMTEFFSITSLLKEAHSASSEAQACWNSLSLTDIRVWKSMSCSLRRASTSESFALTSDRSWSLSASSASWLRSTPLTFALSSSSSA